MLNELHERVSARVTERQAAEAAVVEGVRRELEPFYQQAKRHPRASLKALEAAVPVYQAFIQAAEAEVRSIGQYPDPLRHCVEQIRLTLESAPAMLRAGIEDYENLRFKQVHDDYTRAAVIARLRHLLRSGDGQLGSLERLKAQTESFLKDWLRIPRPPVTTGPMVIREPDRGPAGPAVELEFDPRR